MPRRYDRFRWNEREELRTWLDAQWRKAVVEYQRRGAPFGSSPEGFALWVEFGRITTVN